MTVYVFLDADGDALYVGLTSRQSVRFADHGAKSWWTNVATIRVEHFEAEVPARRRERELILRLRPPHNIAMNPDRDPAWAGYPHPKKRLAV